MNTALMETLPGAVKSKQAGALKRRRDNKMYKESKISLHNGDDMKTVAELTAEELETVRAYIAAGYGYEPEIADAVAAELNEDASYRDWLTVYMAALPYDIIIG